MLKLQNYQSDNQIFLKYSYLNWPLISKYIQAFDYQGFTILLLLIWEISNYCVYCAMALQKGWAFTLIFKQNETRKNYLSIEVEKF